MEDDADIVGADYDRVFGYSGNDEQPMPSTWMRRYAMTLSSSNHAIEDQIAAMRGKEPRYRFGRCFCPVCTEGRA